jgi:hypothetical protein
LDSNAAKYRNVHELYAHLAVVRLLARIFVPLIAFAVEKAKCNNATQVDALLSLTSTQSERNSQGMYALAKLCLRFAN